ETQTRGRGRGGAAMIRLHTAARDQAGGARNPRFVQNEFELADLVSAETERNGIVTLDENRMRRIDRSLEPRQTTDRRRSRPQLRPPEEPQRVRAGIQGHERRNLPSRSG